MTELDWVPLADFCATQKLSERKVKQIIRESAVPVLKIGGRYFLDSEAIEAFARAVRLHQKVVPARAVGRKELERALALTARRKTA
jgi:hypothetical protein